MATPRPANGRPTHRGHIRTSGAPSTPRCGSRRAHRRRSLCVGTAADEAPRPTVRCSYCDATRPVRRRSRPRRRTGRVVDEDAHARGQDPRPYDPSGDSVGVPLAGEPAGLKIGGWPPDDVVTLRCVGGRDSVGRWELWCGPFHVVVSTRMRVVVSLAVPRAAFQDGFR